MIVTDHDVYDWELVAEHASLIVDTRNAVAKAGLNPRKGQLVKA